MLQKKHLTEKALKALKEKNRTGSFSVLKRHKRYISTATRVLAAGS
jgi:hypothetical protein